MKINKTNLDNNHWTTDYIPIGYKSLSKKQFEKSFTFFWNTDYDLHSIIRTYFINNNNIEIGDFWLNENLRGKKINNKKISYLFLKKIISKIWKYYPNCNKITLKVHNNNFPAIKRYESLNFKILKENISNKNLFMNKNGILMVRYKKK